MGCGCKAFSLWEKMLETFSAREKGIHVFKGVVIVHLQHLARSAPEVKGINILIRDLRALTHQANGWQASVSVCGPSFSMCRIVSSTLNQLFRRLSMLKQW